MGTGYWKGCKFPSVKKKKKKGKKKRKKEERKGCKFHEISWLHIFTFQRPKSISIWECKKKKKLIVHPQTPPYLFYEPILQLTLHHSFYFYIQSNKII